MKGNIKSFICGMLVTGVLSGIAVCATDVWQTINVLPNTIKVVVNGKEIQEDNFLYNDTTYLPIRAVSEALGKDVQYDTETSTAIIEDDKEGDIVEATSKYMPPAEYINDTLFFQKQDGIWYSTIDYINEYVFNHGYRLLWDSDKESMTIFKDDTEIYSKVIQFRMKDMTHAIPYDQFVEEIEPLLQ